MSKTESGEEMEAHCGTSKQRYNMHQQQRLHTHMQHLSNASAQTVSDGGRPGFVTQVV